MTTRTVRSARCLGVLREVVLTAAAICGLIGMVAAIATLAFGLQPLIVRSGSMAPALPVGSLALAEDVVPTTLIPGDIVSITPENSVRITHRVVAVDPADAAATSAAMLRLKGDANRLEDPEPYPVITADRVFLTIPYAGYVVSWISTPPAWILGALTALGLGYLAFRPERRTSPESGPGVRPDHIHTTTATALVALAVAVGAWQIHDTRAVFTDSATAVATFTTARTQFFPIAPPISCVNDATPPFGQEPTPLRARLFYPAAPSGVTYRLDFYRVSPPPVVPTSTHQLGISTGYIPATTPEAPASILGPITYEARLYTLRLGVASATYSTARIITTYVSATRATIRCAGTTTSARAAPTPSSTLNSPGPSPGDPAAPPPGSVSPSAEPTPQSTAPADPSAPPTTVVPAPVEPTPQVPLPEPSVPGSPVPEPQDPLPAGGDASPSGDHIAYVDGSRLEIRENTGAVVYSGTISAGALLAWESETENLWIVDGEVAGVITGNDGIWSRETIVPEDLPAEIAALLE